jgi:hypothetical protein
MNSRGYKQPNGEPVFVDRALGQELSILKGFMKTDTGIQAVYAAMDKIKEQRDYIERLDNAYTECCEQLAEKQNDIIDERDKLKLSLNRVFRILSDAIEDESIPDQWDIVCSALYEAEEGLGL